MESERLSEAIASTRPAAGAGPTPGGRWLVVGDDATAALARRITDAPVQQTPTFMTALAELNLVKRFVKNYRLIEELKKRVEALENR